MTERRFAGHRVAVVGASGGIGRALCARFASEGAEVLAVDVDSAGLAALQERGEAHHALVLDLTTASAAAEFGDTLDQIGGLDVLVNSQGITDERDVALASLDDDVFARILAVNLTSVVRLTRAALGHLVASGRGAIVNVSSTASIRATGGTAYVVSKAALNALSSAVAYQTAADRVRCNVVILGPIDTPMLAVSTAKLGSRVTDAAPGVLEGVAQPEEAASLIAFLASDEARHITGSQYRLDGGRLR